MRTLLAALAAGFMATVPAAAQDATADLVDGNGDSIGSVDLTGGPHGVLLRVQIDESGLESGWHGMHFHTVGDCSDVGTFEASEGHVDHGDSEHGLLNENGPEEGDLPNLYVADDGTANAEMFSGLVMLEGDNGLLDDDGSAIVIHANEDDHTSQPIGGAGDRMACGVIE